MMHVNIFNMAKFNERNKARAFRRQGTSIKSIAKDLKVSPASVSVWCRDIILSEDQYKNLKENSNNGSHIGGMIGAETNRFKKELIITKYQVAGRKEIGKLTKRDIQQIGIGLYAGEGFKYSSQVGFCNSDPYIIIFIMRWFREACGVTNDRFRFTIGINQSHKHRINEVKKYWETILHTTEQSFTKVSYKKVASKKVYDNPEKHFGTLTIHIRKSSELMYQILGWINAVFEA
jgi:hypothetical protein